MTGVTVCTCNRYSVCALMLLSGRDSVRLSPDKPAGQDLIKEPSKPLDTSVQPLKTEVKREILCVLAKLI